MDCYEDKVLSLRLPPQIRIGVHHINYSEQTHEPSIHKCAMRLATYIHHNACMKQKVREPL